MSLFGLMWANLFRRRVRTSLTLLSIMIAFLLFCLLQAVSTAFEGGAQVDGSNRLVVASKYSQIEQLPMSQKNQILGIDGVDAVTHSTWFGGVYQDPKNFFAQFPVDPLSYIDMYPDLEVKPAGALQRFARERTTALADVGLVERFGWKIGDVIPINGAIYPKDDGSKLWEFTLVGTISQDGEAGDFPVMLINYEYFNEAVVQWGQDQIGTWVVRVNDTERMAEIGVEIDALFENSTDPTRTLSEDENNREFARQLGDMGFITNMIMSAVFFTIILLTGNTMSQALRERIPELAVLKTLGFTDATVLVLILGEAVLLCLLGGVLGVGLALLIGPGLSGAIESLFGSFAITPGIVYSALALSVLVGFIIGFLPALNAQRLTIVDALRRL